MDERKSDIGDYKATIIPTSVSSVTFSNLLISTSVNNLQLICQVSDLDNEVM